jgi:tetratricopeptide (TPR) repeat protein
MSICARPDCFENGINRCSICLREPYCSGNCQKGDWKSHKSICEILKKLSLKLQPYHEVVRVIEEVLSIKQQQNLRVLGHLLSYADHQFGDRVPGKAYRERGDLERIDNWMVEIGILIPIYSNLVSVYNNDESLSAIIRDNLIFPYLEKMLDILRPWSTHFDSNRPSHVGSLDKDQINHTLKLFSQTERNIAAICKRRNQFDQAENHCQQALFYAKFFEGKEEDKADVVCRALNTFYTLRRDQGNYDEALTFAEEAYNCVAIAYNPVHPKVQNAASTLIECLICKGDFVHAETFAQMTLDSLKDPGNGLDQQSEAVANGYHDLGNVISQQKGDYVKAEKLVRESLGIRSRLHDAHHECVGASIGLLAAILQSQGNLGSETQELYERALVIHIRNFGSEGVNTAASNFNLGDFYHLRAIKGQTTETTKNNLLLSVAKFTESLRIYTKMYGPDHPETMDNSSELSIVLHKLSETSMQLI